VDRSTREQKSQISGAYLACSSVELLNEINSVLSILPQSEIQEINNFFLYKQQKAKTQTISTEEQFSVTMTIQIKLKGKVPEN